MEEKENLEELMMDNANQPGQQEDSVQQPEKTEEQPEELMQQPEKSMDQSGTVGNQEPMFERRRSVYSPTESPKSNNMPVVIVFVLLLLLVAGLSIFVIVSLPKQLEKEIKEVTDSSFFDDFMSNKPEKDAGSDSDKNVGSDSEKNDTNMDEGDIESEDPEGIESVNWDENWQEKFVNHSPEEFTGSYYESTVDCIDESVSYEVNREFFEYEDRENNVCIRASYIQLEGDIPNLDSINNELKTNALWYAQYYEEDSATVLSNIENSEIGFWVESYQYVTYNNDEQISIVLDEHFTYSYYSQPALMSTNINLATGTILQNTQILDLDEDFGKEFRERSDKQNGESQATEIFTDEEIVDMLQDEDALILFYTPIGLELGYSYSRDYYSGWITISMKDYEKYVAGM